MHTSCNLGLRVFTPCGGIGVALFLILSGYGVSESFKKKGTNKFWKNKLIKLWIPYIIILTIVSIYRQKNIDIHLILQFLCLDSPYWYISFLLYNYALFYICHKIRVLYPRKYILFGVLAAGLFLFDTRIRTEQMLCYPCGMLLSDYRAEIWNYLRKHKRIVIISFALILTSIVSLATKQLPAGRNLIEQSRFFENTINLLIKFPFALFLTLVTVMPLRSMKAKWYLQPIIGNRFLKFCSTISLELYLIHFTLIPILDKTHPIYSLILFLILSFSLSSLLYYANKKTTYLWIK